MLSWSPTIELEQGASEADFEVFVPRIRDATIAHLRGLSFEAASKQEAHEELRVTLLEKIHGLGGTKASQVLFTDFVMQ